MPSLFMQALQAMRRVLFLPYCLIGEHPLADGQRLLCARCLSDLPALPSPNVPYGWHQANTPLDSAFSCWEFSPAFQTLIHELKYRRKPLLGELLGAALARKFSPSFPGDPTLLVPVPLHPLRQRERGYNQAGAVARGMSGVWGIPAAEHLLSRTRYTASQTTLTREERRVNLRGAFIMTEADAERVKERDILVVDDVFTTGATAESAARVLKASGARKVYAVTLASAALNTGLDTTE